jgi:DNA-binding winged helix-turn-helix (wHTH) protein/thioredoxin-like negative regulator of GroEL
LGDTHRIDLGEARELRLGGVTVLPSLRTLRLSDGAEQVIEPRMMQVLVALAEAGGGVVTRDTLTRRCWEGRVVGEDAINRVISRLRRTAEEFCGGGFQIETVTKVGYRLLIDGVPPAPPVLPARPVLGRRALIGGGVAVSLAAVSGIAWFGLRRQPSVPADVVPFIEQAMAAMREQSDGGYTRAANLLRHVVDVHPDYADGWGMLACGYAVAGRWRGPPFDASFAGLARAAAARAEQLDPGNRLGRAGLALLLTRAGNHLRIERELRAAIAAHPDNDLLLGSLAGVMMSVGRCRDAAGLLDRALLSAPPSIGTLYSRVQALWAAGRLDEADRAIEQVYAMYPTDITVWFTRFYLLLHTGRAAQALAQERSLRPQGVPGDNIDLVMLVAEAAVSRAAHDVEAAMRANLADR